MHPSKSLLAWLLLCASLVAHAESYQAPFWLPGGHMQTLYTTLLMPVPSVDYRRERLELADGDFIDLDWLNPVLEEQPQAPLVVLFHGLEGNSQGVYARSLMTAVQQRGWRGVVAHFRGCSGEPNRLPRAYFAGDSGDIETILQAIKMRAGLSPLYAVGVSLGGNALLKWLGERGAQASDTLGAAATISATMDLHATGAALDHGFNRWVYARHFLRTLKRKAVQKLQRYPGLFDRQQVLDATTLRAFDDLVTAPLHGYHDTDDYWTRASSKPDLPLIRVPTLLINARNDPFLPESALPRADEVSSAVTLDFPEQGGHVGFISSPFPGRLDWLPQRVLDFFAPARLVESAANFPQ